MLNTIKTLLGYALRFVERNTPVTLPSKSIEDVFNYVRISDKIATSGQPTEQQFGLIKEAGYRSVINLAPTNIIENSLKEESSLLEDLGLNYTHIPVNFDNPTQDDFDTFSDALQSRKDEPVWIHCAVNARVSAFIYRYRRDVLGEDEATARKDLDKIWEPMGVWKKFISQAR